MSKQSVPGQVWDFITAPFQSAQQPSAPATPQTQQPTPQQATTNTTPATLASEARAHSASAILTGGQGLMDQPTTASQVLMGS